MLQYHPVHDPYHTAYRFLRLLIAIDEDAVSYQKLCILDYYLLFPSEIESIKFQAEWVREWKRKFRDRKNPYFGGASKYSVFRQLNVAQEAASRLLTSCGILGYVDSSDDEVSIILSNVPIEVLSEVNQSNEGDRSLMVFLTSHLASLRLYGPSGLKMRTGLMEYRYDPA